MMEFQWILSSKTGEEKTASSVFLLAWVLLT